MTLFRSKVELGVLVFCALYLLSVRRRAAAVTVCNAKEHGRFKCECTEVGHGQIRVDCSGSNFARVPEQGFPRETTELNLRNNRIGQLRTNDFLSTSNLLRLDLVHCDIEEIQPNAFRGLASLNNLMLNNNYLSRIEATTFTHLTNLTYLDLSYNDIYWIAHNAFYFMPALEKIDMRGVKLQCDCETRLLRSWSWRDSVSLTDVKCANFIKDRDLKDIPDDEFGQCVDPPPQACLFCTKASTLAECNKADTSTSCNYMDSCQVTIYVTSGQQLVDCRCQRTSECISGLRLNSMQCVNESPNQRCTFCCAGLHCTNFINLQGYKYQTSMVIGLTLKETFSDLLLQGNSKTYQELSMDIIHQFRYALSVMDDMDIGLEYFRPSPKNLTTVTLHCTSVWGLDKSAAYIQERIYKILNNALLDKSLDLEFDEGSLMVYILGYCEAEVTTSKEGNLHWPDAALGSVASINCPYPVHTNGKARRSCISVWHEQDLIQMVTWSDPDLTECTTPSSVTDQLRKLVDTPITSDTVDAVIKSLRELTYGMMTTTDLEYTSLTLKNIMNANVRLDENTSSGIVATYNNLMLVDISTLQQSERNFHSIKRALMILDKFSQILLSTPKALLTERQISVGILSPEILEGGLTFHVSKSDSMAFHPGRVFLFENRTEVDPKSSEGSITLPAGLLNTAKGQNTSVQFVAYNDDVFFRAMAHNSNDRITSQATMENTTSNTELYTTMAVNSLIIAASIGELPLEHLPGSVVVTFRHRAKGASSPRCVFWDFDNDVWSSQGCHVVDDVVNEYTICECDHLTNFALIMDIYGEGGDLTEGHKLALSVISYIGCGVSLAALLLTLIAYSISSKLRKDNPSKLLMNLCVALSLVMIFFIVVIQPVVWNNAIACKATAILLHYFLLSTWMWMAVEAFYMYLALIKIFKTYISRFVLKSCLFGWGVPAIIVIITVSVSRDNYGNQENICWLSRMPFYGACLAPIALTLIANFIIFGMVIHQLRGLSARNDERMQKHYGIKTQLRGAIAVVVLLGLTWIFAIFAVDKATPVFQYLFCIFNSFQGLFIFLFYCVMKKDVKDTWREKWTEFTSTATSSDQFIGKGDKCLYRPSRSVPHSTLTIDDSRITASHQRMADQSTLTGSTEYLSCSKNRAVAKTDGLMNESET